MSCKIFVTFLFILMISHSYGGKEDSYPHPELDFRGFLAAIERENKRCSPVWDPVTKRLRPWINPRYIKRPAGSGCVMM